MLIQKFIIAILSATAVLGYLGSATADMTVADYRSLRPGQDQQQRMILQLYIEASYSAIQTTIVRYEADGYPKAYCPAGNKLFTIDELYSMIDEEVVVNGGPEKNGYGGSEPVEFALLNALQSAFPCQAYLDLHALNSAPALDNPKIVFACTQVFETLNATTKDETKKGLYQSARNWFVALERQIEDDLRRNDQSFQILEFRKHGLDAGAYVSMSLQSQKNTLEMDNLNDLCIGLLDRTEYPF